MILSITPLAILSIIGFNFASNNITSEIKKQLEKASMVQQNQILLNIANMENSISQSFLNPSNTPVNTSYIYTNYAILDSSAIRVFRNSSDTVPMNDLGPWLSHVLVSTEYDKVKRLSIDNYSNVEITMIVPTILNGAVAVKQSFNNFKEFVNVHELQSNFIQTVIFNDGKILYKSENRDDEKESNLISLFENEVKTDKNSIRIKNKLNDILVIKKRLALYDSEITIVNYIHFSSISSQKGEMLNNFILSFICIMLIVLLFTFRVTHNILNPITILSKGIKDILDADYLKERPKNLNYTELNHIWENILEIIAVNIEIRRVAESASKGNFSCKIENHKESDITSESINKMIDYFNNVIYISDKITHNDFDIQIDAEGSLNVSLIEMARRLEENNKIIENENWIYDGDTYLSQTLLEQNDVDVFCRKIIKKMVSYTKASSGIFFLSENYSLRIKSSANISFKDPDYVLEKEYNNLLSIITSTNQVVVPKKDPQNIIESIGIYEINNHNLIFQPLFISDELIGVMLLTFDSKIPKKTESLLDYTAIKIAMSLSITLNMIKIRGQLQQSKIDNTTINSQKEALNTLLTELEEKNEQLVTEYNRAESANKVKSNFIANMSHEIRTPMNSIIGFTDLLKSDIKDETGLRYLNAIQNSSSTLLEFVNKILDISKIEANKIELKLTPTDLKSLVNNTCTMFEPILLQKQLELEIDSSGYEKQEYLVDELRIKQILTNLISNAIKFTEKGEVVVSISSSKVNANTAITIEVKDSGIGINKEQQERIFDSFVQKDGQDTRTYGGTGLGLAISRKLAIMMNGSLTVESEDNVGSTFTLTIHNVTFENTQSTDNSSETDLRIGSDNHIDLQIDAAYFQEFKNIALPYIKLLNEAFDLDIVSEFCQAMKDFGKEHNISQLLVIEDEIEKFRSNFDIIEVENIIERLERYLNEQQ